MGGNEQNNSAPTLEELRRRLPDYEIREQGVVRIHSSNVRGFAALPIEFEP